jgi:hypothetical protein
MSCEHANFAANVGVHRLEDVARFIAEIRIECADCGLAFSFTGLPLGISIDRAMLNIDATIASIPIEPGPKPIPIGGSFPVEMPKRRES